MGRYLRFCWLPFLVSFLFSGLVLFVWNNLVKQHWANLVQMTRLAERDVLKEIKTRLEFQLNALQRLAARWEVYVHLSEEEWRKDVLAHVKHHPGYRSIQWVDSNYIVRWVVPSGNEQVRNMRADFEARRKEGLKRAEENSALYISPILDLIQGGKGFIVYLPVYVNGKNDGFIVGVIDIYIFLHSILGEYQLSYEILVEAGQEPLYTRAANGHFKPNRLTQHRRLCLNNLKWDVYVQPTSAFIRLEQTFFPELILSGGLFIAVLLAILTYLVQATRQSSEKLRLANEELQHEIKERENAELAKDKLKRALLQSQKLEAIGTLAGGIAHDFNNILYSVIGYTELALEDLPRHSITYKNLTKVIAVSKRGQELVTRLLSFSRQQQHTFEVISLLEVITSTLTLLKPTIPASVEMTLETSVEQAIIKGSYTDLQQVLVNVIGNAVDAIEGKGAVKILLSQVELTEELRQNHPTLTQLSYYLVEIIDNGPGMSKATLERAFEPFFTTKPVGKGTGLGLATAHGIIQEHSGLIGIRSQLGEGTVVYIYLPHWGGGK